MNPDGGKVRILLATGPYSTIGGDGGLAVVLAQALERHGAQVTLATDPATIVSPIVVDWWLVLDYVTRMSNWMVPFYRYGGGAQIAYTEGVTVGDGILSLPWHGTEGTPLKPFAFVVGGRPQLDSPRLGVIVDHAWPGYREQGLDLTQEIVSALDGYPGRKVALATETMPSTAGAGWEVRLRMERTAFLELLAQADAVVLTHKECYSMVVHEALFFGTRVLVCPAFVTPGVLTFEGVFAWHAPADIPTILAQVVSDDERTRWSMQIGDVDAAAIGILKELSHLQGTPDFRGAP